VGSTKLFKIVYSKKYRNSYHCQYFLRHCIIVTKATSRPFNVLVKLRGGELVIVPNGNLVDTKTCL
jgi:hypothetical protein